MEVLARNLSEVTEDIWKLWVLFFQQLPAFGKMRAGRVPRKMRLLKKWSYLVISCKRTPAGEDVAEERRNGM